MDDNQSPWSKTEFLPIGPLTDGTGSFGTVWKAQHALIGIEYAIKQVFIDKTLKYFDRDVNKLFREVKLLQAINHRNVVRYFYCWLEGPNVKELPDRYVLPTSDSSWTSGRPPPTEKNFLFIQMELCDKTLKQWMAETPTIENRTTEICKIIIQVTTGLKAIHEQKIIHRDLKPDNIFKLGTIWKIGDFGLSTKSSEKLFSEASKDNNTTYSAAGCEKYRSPELQNTMKSDVYTLGLIFLQIIIPSFKPYTYDLINGWIYGQNPTDGIKKLVSLNNLIAYGIISQMLNPYEALRPDSQTILNLFTQIYNTEANTTSTNSRNKNENNIVDQDPISFEVRKPVSNFTGRVFQLSELHKAYKQRRCLLVISGLGGVGKTELVKNFASSFYNNYQGNCLWMESEDEQRLVESVKRLADEMKIDKINVNITTIFRNVYKKLNALPTLLIFDNVDTVNPEVENIIRSFRNLPPGTEPPLIVITTRNKEVISLTGGESIELQVLDDNEAIELITNSVSQINQQDAKMLCKTLQNFPLAMQQAICYINYRRKIGKKFFNIPDYLKLFEQQKKKILGHRLTLADHDYSLTTLTTWNMSFESIKSDEELGPVAVEVLDFWAYEILNPDGESLSFVVELYENFDSTKSHESQANTDLIGSNNKWLFLETINYHPLSSRSWKLSANKNFAKRRSFDSFNFNEHDINVKEEEPEIDLIDDDRKVSQAIHLIQTYSMCNVELRYVNNVDKQFLTIHRLVQEVIRISKVKNQEFEFLQTFIRYLLHSTFRIWSNTAEDKYRKRERIIKSVWPFVSKHIPLVSEFGNVFKDIWLDCIDGFVPFEYKLDDVKFLNEVLHSLFTNSHESNLSTMVVEYFFLRSDLCFKFAKSEKNRRYDQWKNQLFLELTENNQKDSGFEPIKLFELFQRQKRFLTVDHLLSIETLDLLTNWINEKGVMGLGGADNNLAVSNAAKVCLDILNVFIRKERPMSSKQLLRVLIIVGQTIEGFRILNNFESIVTFSKNVFEIVQICINPTYIYMLKSIGYCMLIVGMEQKANEFSSELETKLGFQHDLTTVDKDVAYKLISESNRRTFELVPVSIAMKLIDDTLYCFEYEACNDFLDLSAFFETLITHGCFEFATECVKKALNVCTTLCSKEKHENALTLLLAIKTTETKLWEAGRQKECMEIGQNLPKFCKYQKQFKFPNLIVKWIDDIMSRFEKHTKPLELPTNVSENTLVSSIFSRQLPEVSSGSSIHVPHELNSQKKVLNSKALPHHLVQKFSKNVTVVKPDSIVAFVKPDANVALVKPDANVAVVKPDVNVALVKPDANVALVKPDANVALVKPDANVALVNPGHNVALVNPGPNVAFVNPGIDLIPNSVYSNASGIIARSDHFWETEDFETWQQYIETNLSEIQDADGLVVYMKSKISQDICEKLTDLGYDLSTIPTKVLQWAFLFTLQNHHSIMETKSQNVIQLIVDNLKEQKDHQSLMQFGQIVCELWVEANLDKPIVPLDTPVVITEEIPNFWYCFLTIESIGVALRYLSKNVEDLKLTRTFLKLEVDCTISEIYQTQIKIMKYYLKGCDRSFAHFVIIPTVVQLIDQFYHYRFNFPPTDTVCDEDPEFLIEFIQNFIFYMKIDSNFGRIIIMLSKSLSDVKEKSEIHLKLAERFALNNIIKELIKTDKHLSDALCLIETALATNLKCQELTDSIELELNAIVAHVIENFHSIFQLDTRLTRCCVRETVFVALKFESVDPAKIETLVVKILDQFVESFNYEKIYDFGVQISCIPKSDKLRLKLIMSLIMDYLAKACEIDLEKMRRIFKTKCKCKTSVKDYTLHFSKLVDRLFDKFQIEFKEGEVYFDMDDECKDQRASYQSVQLSGHEGVQPLELD